eukprot:SAG22_NODE_731_length_7588_cov_6.237281_4_plen_46_part_00
MTATRYQVFGHSLASASPTCRVENETKGMVTVMVMVKLCADGRVW